MLCCYFFSYAFLENIAYEITTEYPHGWLKFLKYVLLTLPGLLLGILGLVLEYKYKNITGFSGPLLSVVFPAGIAVSSTIAHYGQFYYPIFYALGCISLLLCFTCFYKLGDRNYKSNILGSINKYFALGYVIFFWSVLIYIASLDCSKVGDMCGLGKAMIGAGFLILALSFSIIWVLFAIRHRIAQNSTFADKIGIVNNSPLDLK